MNSDFTIPAGVRLTIGVGQPRPAETDSYAFLLNVSALVDATSFTLAPGHELRRANTAEITAIKELLYSQMPDLKSMNPWESRKGTDGSFEELPEAEWKYFVIGFRGTNTTLVDIEQALLLTSLELKIAFTVMRWQSEGGLTRAVMTHHGRLFQQLQRAMWAQPHLLDVTRTHIEEVIKVLAQWRQHDNRLVDVQRITKGILDLESLPHKSPILFLGYFALLESLLAHKPNPTDVYQSITRQVTKKIALLDHRFDRHIDYGPFAGLTAEKVWKKMYAYRSCLAHGDEAIFKDELQALGSHANALNLVKEVLKAVIRQALIEPSLIADLREC